MTAAPLDRGFEDGFLRRIMITRDTALRGVFPIAPTPFTPTGELDLEGQRRVLDGRCRVGDRAGRRDRQA
jgi:hypothetical protein